MCLLAKWLAHNSSIIPFQVYHELTQGSSRHQDTEYLTQSKKLYEEALNSIPFGEVPPGYEGEWVRCFGQICCGQVLRCDVQGCERDCISSFIYNFFYVYENEYLPSESCLIWQTQQQVNSASFQQFYRHYTCPFFHLFKGKRQSGLPYPCFSVFPPQMLPPWTGLLFTRLF